MKHLTIWICAPKNPFYERCVLSQRRHLSTMEYECIDDIKAVAMLNEANEKYHGVNSIEEYMSKPYATPDYLRAYALSLEPQVLYCDSDVELYNEPDRLDEKPAMEYHENTDLYNPGIVWNGFETEIFDEFCRYWFRQKEVQLLYGALGKVAKDNNFHRYEFMAPWYKHYMYGLASQHGTIDLAAN